MSAAVLVAAWVWGAIVLRLELELPARSSF